MTQNNPTIHKAIGNSVQHQRLAWLLWIVFLLFLFINRLVNAPGDSEVFLIYTDAALRWLNGEALYRGNGTGFIYPPQSALFFIPFTWIPPPWDTLLWRLINTSIFCWGIYRLCEFTEPRNTPSVFLWATISTILMGASAAKLGQLTLTVTGLMLLAIVHILKKRFLAASFLLAMSLALKPLTLVVVLLCSALYLKLVVWLLLWLILLWFFPFLTQNTEYVISQLKQTIPTMLQVVEYGRKVKFSQIFWMIDELAFTVPTIAQSIFSATVGFFTLVWCFILKKRLVLPLLALYLSAISVCYLLLFNSRTEGNTYVMLAPMLGIFWYLSKANENRWTHGVITLLFVCFIMSTPVSRWLSEEKIVWVKPALTLVFLLTIAIWRQYPKNNQST